MRSTALALLAACAAFCLSASAQEPPGRVGRISFLEGPASVYQDPDTGWQEALLNIPVTSENSVWTDRGARAEVQVGGSALRLASRTQLDISRLDDSGLDATVAEGRASLRVRYKQPNEHYDLSTPSAAFEITRDGLYRLEYNADYDESRFSVIAGDARMHSDYGDVTIGPGRMIVVSGGDSPSYDIFAAARPDGFDRWVQTRDARFHPPRYVSPYMTGYQDLDAYGNWSNDPDYGQVWYPTRVSVDWAPYREGRWSYVEPWGWTWVDDAPWGYAPFHYGRWVNVHDRWGWIPGKRVERPTWAPALVAFIGLSSASSTPSVGWYPLAPGEQYHPWYRADSRYTERINQVVVGNQPRQNTQARGEQAAQLNRDRGVTVVNRNALIQRAPVQQSRIQVTPQAIRQQTAVAPAQVMQALPQRTEIVRHRQETATKAPQPPAPTPAVAARQQQAAPGKAPSTPGAAPVAPTANAIVRPAFRREQAPKPAPAPTPAARATQQSGKAPPPAPANPIARTPPALPGAPAKAPESKGPAVESKAPAPPAPNAPAANNPAARFPIAPPASGETKAQQESQRQQDNARRLEEMRQQRQQQQSQQQQQQQQQIQQRQQQQEAQKQQQQEAQKQQQQEAQKQQQQEAQKQQQQQRELQQRLQQGAQQRQEQEAQQRQQQEAKQRQQQEAQKQQQQQRELQQRLQQGAQQRQEQEAQQRQQQEAKQRQQQEAQKQQQLEAQKQQQQLQQQQRLQQQQERSQPLQRAPQAAVPTPQEKKDKEKEKEKEKDKDKDKNDKQPR